MITDRPGNGLSFVLGESTARVARYCWQAMTPNGFSVRDVYEALRGDGLTPAYTTVATQVVTLVDAGLARKLPDLWRGVDGTRKNAWRYAMVVGAEKDFMDKVEASVLARLRSTDDATSTEGFEGLYAEQEKELVSERSE